MTARTLLVAVGAALAGAAVTALVYGGHAALIVLEILLPLGVVTVAGAALLVRRRRALGGLRRQLALLGALVLAQLLVATALLVDQMFVSHHDALFTLIVAADSALVGVAVTRLMTRSMLADVERVRDGLVAVGDGARDVAFAASGSDEIAELAQAAALMQERLATEEQARRQLVASVSHDLRTPITALRLLSDAVDDGLVSGGEREQYFGRIGVHVRQLGALIDDLFELSRLEAGDIRWSFEQVELHELVGETVEAMGLTAGGVSVRMEVGDDVGPARANPEQVQRVLFNLIQNAVRHTPADGSVVVRAQTLPGCVEIEVADTGEGIADADRETIFEPFVQGSGGARSGGSAGLGLAIARAIVEAHGGRIWLAEADAGTRVRFSLPHAV